VTEKEKKKMILLFTDFGHEGPYLGLMRATLAREAPRVQVIDLMHDAPSFDAKSSAYLLASLISDLPEDCVVCGVVDPGVGSDRPPVVLKADQRWFVGPGNGLFEIAARRAEKCEWQRLDLMPRWLSSTFHGRDLFAPAAARLALGRDVPTKPLSGPRFGEDWGSDLGEVIYVDAYGNATTGLRSSLVTEKAELIVNGRRLNNACKFSDMPPGEAFWYANANGLIEIAVNQGSAAAKLSLHTGVPINIIPH
jgi:S-adenosylmethionine hydrolase